MASEDDQPRAKPKRSITAFVFSLCAFAVAAIFQRYEIVYGHRYYVAWVGGPSGPQVISYPQLYILVIGLPVSIVGLILGIVAVSTGAARKPLAIISIILSIIAIVGLVSVLFAMIASQIAG